MTTTIDLLLRTEADFIAGTPGIYPKLRANLYHAATGIVSSTHLKNAEKSMAHMKAAIDGGDDDRDCLVIGDAAHAAILEPVRFAAEYAVGPDVKLNTKEGKAEWAIFAEANPGKTLIRGVDGPVIAGVRDALWSHPLVREMLECDGMTEPSIVWTDENTGLSCKCRPDCHILYQGQPTILDIKTCQRADKRAFPKVVAERGYHISDPFYRDGCKKIIGEDHRFVFVAVEKAPPYAVGVYELDSDSVALGRLAYQELLGVVAHWRKKNEWPKFSSNYSRAIETIRLPAWAAVEE